MKTGWKAARRIIVAAAIPLMALPPSCNQGHDDAVAQVNEHRITRAEADERLRSILWRNGETWGDLEEAVKQRRRQEAAEQCVDDYLLEEFAKTQPVTPSVVSRQAGEDFQQFLKQFEPPDAWEKRMALQGLNATALKNQITAGTAQTLALESWLASQTNKVTEADALAWYEAHRASLTVPERVRARQIFLTNHDNDKPDRTAEIQEISRKLSDHESGFPELAASFSEDDGSKKRGGDMGWFSAERVPKEFAEKVFALTVGQISEPFESHLGWHIVLVSEKRPARAAEVAEVKDEILALLDTSWREEALKQLREKLRAGAKVEFFAARLRLIGPE